MNKIISFSMNVLKKYRWDSLFLKYWYKLSAIVLIPLMAIFLMIVSFYSSNEVKDWYNTQFVEHSRTVMSFENTFDNINKIYINLICDNDIINYISKPTSEYSGLQISNLTSRISTSVNSVINTHSYVDSIHIFNFKSPYVLSSIGNGYIDNFTDLSCYNYYINTHKSNFTIPTSYLYNNTNKENISFSYGIYIDQKLYGLLVINVSRENLIEYAGLDKSVSCIINSDNKVVFSADDSNKLDDSLFKYLKSDNLKLYSRKQVILLSPVANTSFRYLSVSYPESTQSKEMIFLIIILCIIAVLLISLALSFFLSAQFYKSIAVITSQLDSVQQNEAETDDNNELKHISSRILNLMNRNESMEHELVEKITNLKKAQYVALQTQINPHFLFNTLGLVNMIIMSTIKKPNNAERLVTLLSEILRYSLDTKKYIVSVKDEINALQKYIEIEKIKYRNNFDVDIAISPDAMECEIIKYILQPIVENAFKHGIRPLTSKRGNLIITAKTNKKFLIITISDNGTKIPPEKLKKIQKEMLDNNFPEDSHIGLSNVHSRIKLICGEEYGCYISSGENGTTVSMLLPNNKIKP